LRLSLVVMGLLLVFVVLCFHYVTVLVVCSMMRSRGVWLRESVLCVVSMLCLLVTAIMYALAFCNLCS
jgi:hypothetical protein